MRTIQHKFVEFIPETLEDGILYITIEYRTAVHKWVVGQFEICPPFKFSIQFIKTSHIFLIRLGDMPLYEIMSFIGAFLVSCFMSILTLWEKKTYWKLKFFIWLFLSCFTLLFGIMDINDRYFKGKEDVQAGIDTTVNSAKEIQKAIDSTKRAIFDSINYSSNRLKDSIRQAIKNSQRPEAKKAFIDLTPRGEHNNPEIIYSTDRTQAICNVYFTNFGNDIAINIVDDIYIVNYIGGKFIFNNMYSDQISNKSTTMAPNAKTMASFGLNVPEKKYLGNPAYIYVKLTYANSINKEKEVLRRILAIKPEGTENIPATEYNKVENDLKKSNLY